MINSIEISLKSFEYKLLNTAFLQILSITPNAWQINKFVLPCKTKQFTVLRSPHIDKKSREQFKLKTYKSILRINPTILHEKELIKLNKGEKALVLLSVVESLDLYPLGKKPCQVLNKAKEDLFIENLKYISFSGVQIQIQILYKSFLQGRID